MDLNLNPEFIILIIVVVVWTYIWKGMALWHAAKKGQRNWFVAFLVISSLGILEMTYFWRFEKKK